ncbi:fungal-specific transcription factor domain-containing protein [Colletotrichum navitas]|uniref:Fungal-specific transcription factor domain-containing protein n=1 Tax=Colletotrichum navitas TaxID=681940 RepID=A0AAD8UYF1_9PEZI|nr:fungal-specific transcription factor domain-containing protein [Colletotrichum navitas]KAK1570061.1 fungal-specific transcription factor domain-containing protein [Colletotrichum navitas]
MESQPDFQHPSSFREEGQQVITRACDRCRRRKIRCDPTMEGCVQCTKYHSRCHFTPITTKKNPRRPAGYIAKLEERLFEVEALLGNNSLSETTTPGISYNHSGTELLTLEGDKTGRFIGKLLSYSAPELRAFSRPAQQQLPTTAFALELVNETFTNYNRFLPLFDKDDFLGNFQLKYSTSNPGDADWWACLNVVLSIAHRLRALRSSDPERENHLASGYMRNALGVVAELSVSNRSLSAVQALVGMACILQGTPNPQPASVLVAAALRLAQAMDLHRDCSSMGLTQSEAEQRRRVFWKIYILDKDISLRTCCPFNQDDDEMDIRLPSNTNLASGYEDLFNHRIGLAVIQGQVYKQLYSVHAGRQTETQRAIAAQALSSLLSRWNASAQLDSPDDPTSLPGCRITGYMIHKVVLRLTYIHCLAMVDRHLVPMVQPRFNQEVGRPQVSLHPGTLCLVESRRAIRLVAAIPPGDRACVWMLLHAFFAATRSILYNLTQNPMSPNALSDLHLVEPFLRLLDTLLKDPRGGSQSEELGRIHTMCNNLNDEAKKAVQIFGSRYTASLT